MFTKELICTWFGSSQQFDYVTKLLVVFYIFKTILEPNGSTNEMCLQLLWDCIKAQEFKSSIRASYIVSKEVKLTELSLEQHFFEIMTRFVKEYPHLVLNNNCKDVASHPEALLFDNDLDYRKVSQRYMTQLNQFMVCMKVVYPNLPEPEQVNEDEFMEPDWINTILKEFEGIRSEAQWFAYVKVKISSKEDNLNQIEMSNGIADENKENEEASIPKKKSVNQNETVDKETLTSKPKKTLVEDHSEDDGERKDNDERVDDEEDFISKNILSPSRQKKRRRKINNKSGKNKKNDVAIANTDTTNYTRNDLKRKFTDITNCIKMDDLSNDWIDCFHNRDSDLFSIVIKDLNRSDLDFFQGIATEYFGIE